MNKLADNILNQRGKFMVQEYTKAICSLSQTYRDPGNPDACSRIRKERTG